MRHRCPCPVGCIVGESIDPADPEDSVRCHCSNPRCDLGVWIHAVCLRGWERDLMAQRRGSGSSDGGLSIWEADERGRCGCGEGVLRLASADDCPKGRGNRGNRRRGPNGKTFHGQQQSQVAPRMRNRAASMGSGTPISVNVSDKGFGQSPPHSYGPPHGHHGRRDRQRSENGPGSEFFSDSQVGKTGSIFARRSGFQSLKDALPNWKLNGFHIKLEDDCPQGNDDTRIFLLTTLGDHKMREIKCVLCCSEMRVYDRYPLVDGTFFLSPVNHHSEGLPVRHDTRDSFLHALCVGCLESASDRLACVRCGGRGWFPGASLVLGSLYSYDVLSSSPCCPPACRQCSAPLPLPEPALHQFRHFSAFSEISNCQNCGHRDSHYIRRLDSMRLLTPNPPTPPPTAAPAIAPFHPHIPLAHMLTA